MTRTLLKPSGLRDRIAVQLKIQVPDDLHGDTRDLRGDTLLGRSRRQAITAAREIFTRIGLRG
jgi:hypothetical protein